MGQFPRDGCQRMHQRLTAMFGTGNKKMGKKRGETQEDAALTHVSHGC